MASVPKAIGLLGGTFDPVHKGHISIVHSYLDSGYLDKLFLILTPEPPHKENRELTDFRHRKKMLERALGGLENLVISTIEQRLPKPSYTINTIDFFASEYPDAKLYLCMGEDSLLDFKNWYRWEDIVAKCTLLVARRPDTPGKTVAGELEGHVRYIDHEAVNISSSAIRDSIKSGKSVKEMLPDEVISYINKHHLYQN